jgi:hypothetical protein
MGRIGLETLRDSQLKRAAHIRTNAMRIFFNIYVFQLLDRYEVVYSKQGNGYRGRD